MQNHVKKYYEYLKLQSCDTPKCERCGAMANDIHHIIPRSKFGSKIKDEQNYIYNLIALCRNCHNMAHLELISKKQLQEIHEKHLNK